jgi:GH25 family lysozyme M1 (1,4-beta-N-acetylmuramidase)
MDSIKEILEKTLYIHWEQYSSKGTIGGIDDAVNLIEERSEHLREWSQQQGIQYADWRDE